MGTVAKFKDLFEAKNKTTATLTTKTANKAASPALTPADKKHPPALKKKPPTAAAISHGDTAKPAVAASAKKTPTVALPKKAPFVDPAPKAPLVSAASNGMYAKKPFAATVKKNPPFASVHKAPPVTATSYAKKPNAFDAKNKPSSGCLSIKALTVATAINDGCVKKQPATENGKKSSPVASVQEAPRPPMADASNGYAKQKPAAVNSKKNSPGSSAQTTPPKAAPSNGCAKQQPAAVNAKKKPSTKPGHTIAGSHPARTADSPTAMPALSERNSSNYTATDIAAAFRVAPACKWRTTIMKFSGTLSFMKIEEQVVKGKSIQEAIEDFHARPAEYSALMFQSSMETMPPENCQYTWVMRQGTSQLVPQGVDPSGWMTLMIHEYQQLPPFPNNELPKDQRDSYTHKMTVRGRTLPKPLLPGRGMGVGDMPNLKIFGDIDPSDILQGTVGDCWLLSAISAVAEFDGAIKRIFRKTKDLDSMPLDDGSVNMYTISLFDLKTWKEVVYVIDESLCANPSGKGLLAARPSEDGELWVCYLEKGTFDPYVA
jgi:Calpain family cysteine protease